MTGAVAGDTDRMSNVKVTTNRRAVTQGPNHAVIRSPDGLTGVFTKFGNEVLMWCHDSGIDANLIEKWYDDGSFSMWEINVPEHRAMFILRWSAEHINE